MLSHNSFSHTTNQSVFKHYLLHGTAPPEYVNVSSRDIKNAKINKKKNKYNEDNKIRNKTYKEFLLTKKNSLIQINKKVEIIENLDEVNLVKWIEGLEVLKNDLEMEDDDLRIIIRSTIETKVKSKLGEVQTSKEIFTKLKQLKYSAEKASIYQKRLDAIKQTGYALIDQYLEAINENVDALTNCLNYNETEQLRKVNEHYISGLGPKTRIKFLLKDMDKFEEIHSIIRKTEYIILDEWKIKNPIKKHCSLHGLGSHTTSECRSNRRPIQKSGNKNYEYKAAKTHKYDKGISTTKHCSFHNCNTHSNEERRAQNNKNSINRHIKKPKGKAKNLKGKT